MAAVASRMSTVVICAILASGLLSFGASAAQVAASGAGSRGRDSAAVFASSGTGDASAMGKNPIRKVVQLLEKMAKTVAAEGEKEEELYEKFACYCKTGEADLKQSISSNDAKVPALQSDIEEAQSTVAKLREDLKQHEADRTAAKAAMAEATALREKENAKFVQESTELKGYIDSLAKAVPAIQSGMAGTRLLQTGTAAALIRKAASSDAQLTEDDRASVVAFFGGIASARRYIPASGEIVGILTTMKEDFEKDLAGVTATEEEAQKLYDDLMTAKTKEVDTLGASIEKKTARAGELEVEIVHMRQDLSESEAMLIEDKKFLAELAGNCESKATEWEERKKVRAEELSAIYDTIKILNDDDALDIFKKTLASASFMQLVSGQDRMRRNALALVRKLRTGRGAGGVTAALPAVRPEVRFLEVALEGGKVDFSKVIKMIDDMVALLVQEQADDDGKKGYCEKQIDSVEDKTKVLSKSVEDLEIMIEDKTEAIATTTEEIKTLRSEISELDRLVTEATEQRKKENEEFTQLMAENTQAKELLAYAKNRLNKFYNPSLHKPEPKTEEAEGSFLQRTSAVRLHSRRTAAAPEPAPETWGEYRRKGEQSGGVISMIDLLIRDLTKEMTVAETDEEHAQKEYERFMTESAGKRAKAVRAVAIKESAKADNEAAKTVHDGDKKETSEQLAATQQYLMQLHSECDWLMQNYDLRKTARSEESDTLKQAKAILSGADFSFVQAATRPRPATLLSRGRGA